MGRWVSQELETLRSRFGRAPIAQIAAGMGRTPSAVAAKARQIGLHAKRPWTEEEIARLKTMVEAGQTAKEIARELRRSPAAVQAQCSLRKIHLSCRAWSKKEIAASRKMVAPGESLSAKEIEEIIRGARGGETNAAMAARLHRSKHSIREIRRRLKLPPARKKRTWSEEQVETVRRCYLDHTAAEIAAMIGKSADSIRSMASGLGLYKGQDGAWSGKEINLLKRLYPITDIEEIVRRLGKTESAVRTKAFRLKLRKKSPWSEEQRRQLKELVKKKAPVARIAAQLGRSSYEVIKERDGLGRLRRAQALWTPEEIGLLKALVSSGATIPQIARQLRRTAYYVHRKAIELGLILPRLDAGWTPEEIRILGQRYPVLTAAEIAALLGKSVCAVQNMAFRLNLRKRRAAAGHAA